MKIIDARLDFQNSELHITFDNSDAVSQAFAMIQSNFAEQDINRFDNELLTLVRAGRFIDAIKLRRAKTNESLKDSKEYVDKLRLQHGV